METEPVVLVALFVALFMSLVACGVLAVAARRRGPRHTVLPAQRQKELLAPELERTRGAYEVQLTRVLGEREQALVENRSLRSRLAEVEGGVEAAIAAQLKVRLAAALEAEVEARVAAALEARVEARLTAAFEAKVERGVAARIAEASAAAARNRSQDGAEVPDPPGGPPLSPAVPSRLPLGRDSGADSTVDGADLGPLIVRSASVRGDLQREDGEHRRDAVHLGLVEEITSPTLLSVVAAGAPRGPWSRSAAERACRSLAAQLGHYGERLGTELYQAAYATTRVPADDSELGGLLRTAVQGVAHSVRLVARNETGGVSAGTGSTGAAGDAAVELALTGLLSRLGDHQLREHVAFGIGDGSVLRLREGVWDGVFTGARQARLPTGSQELRWARLETRPGDLLAVCSAPMAELLLREDLGDWFAERWVDRRPFLTTFFSDVNVRVRSAGGDRSVVCLWDFGEARRTRDQP